MKFFKSFISDDDGFSAKDFLMVIFGTLFVLMIATAFIISIVATLNPATILVIQLLDTTMITIVGGVFSLQGIKEFKKAIPVQSTITSTTPNGDISTVEVVQQATVTPTEPIVPTEQPEQIEVLPKLP
jgi:hypothetical protein